MSHPKCVALDFDLTIFDYRRPADTRVLIPWFDRLHKDGKMVGIASGRTLADLKYELQKIEMPWEKPFPHFVIHEEFYIHWPGSPAHADISAWNATCAGSVESLCQAMRPSFDVCASEIAARGVRIEKGVEETRAGISLVLENPAGAEQARLLLQEIVGTAHDARISRNHHILLATPAAYHKGTALNKLRSLADLAPDEVLAIGDNLNDLAMLEDSMGFRCATVGNAEPLVSELVTERGGHIAQALLAFGVVEIFEKTFEASGTPFEIQLPPVLSSQS